MKIFALDSETEEFQELINSLAEKISIDLFDDFDGMIEVVDDKCQAVLLDYDVEARKKNKMITKIKKSFPDMNIFLLANDLDAKKLAKHQNSKTGAHVYFQTPVDEDILDSILEPFIGYDDTPIDEDEVLADHQPKDKMSQTATNISSDIDGAFSSTFFDEYAEGEQGDTDSLDSDLGDINLDQGNSGSAEVSMDEVSLDEVSMDEVSMDDVAMDEVSMDEVAMDDVDMDEVSMDEVAMDTAVEEVSMSDEEIDSMSLADDDDGFNLDEAETVSEEKQEEWSDQEDLSLAADDSPEDAGNIAFPDEDDLSFPEIDISEVESSNEAEVGAAESGLQEMELKDEGTLQEMELAPEETIAQDTEDDALVMDIDDSEGLDLGGADEVASAEAFDPTEMTLDAEDEAPIAESTSGDDELSLDEEQTSPSQVFDLAAAEEESEAESGLLEALDDGQDINLGSEAEDDAASGMNTSADLVTGMDENLGDDEVEEITKTQMTNPLEGLEELGLSTSDEEPQDLDLTIDEPAEATDDDQDIDFGLNVPSHLSEDLSGQDDIGALINQAETNLDPNPETTGVTIQGLSINDSLTDDDLGNEAQTGISFANNANPLAAQEEVDKVDTKTSIQLTDESLSSIDLPEAPEFIADETSTELPQEDAITVATLPEGGLEDYEEDDEFSTTVNQKLQEIDSMIEDSDLEDRTMIVNREDIQTNIYATQGISDDTRVIEQGQGANDATVVMQTPNVPQDLKQEHRDYVQSHDEELIRLGETIKNLREDRESLMAKLADFESAKDEENREQLNLKAELDEKNIELVVIKKRMDKQIDDLRFQLDIALDKKELYAKQNEKLKQEVEKLSRQTKLDINKIRARERELEEKLEMLRNDAEVQIRNRDQKILELKRRIDTLEFDVESSHMKEKKSIDEQMDLQDKMNRVISTLRGAIGQLEDDYGADERKKNIKKNLDI